MITRVAFKGPDGVVYSMAKPYRHHHIIRALTDYGKDAEYIAKSDQGFMTEDWKYMDRKEAYRIATEKKQIIHHTAHTSSDELYSEDLW